MRRGIAFYGVGLLREWLPLEKLRQECGVTRDGVNAKNILRAARRLGCIAKGFAGKPEVLRRKEFPLILFWEFNHFVVLEGFEGDTVYLNDPALGWRKISWKDFLTSYTGIYLNIRPGEEFRQEGRPYNVAKAVAEKLAEDKWAILFVLILGLCMIVPGLAVPVMNQIFIDDVFSMKHPDWTKKLFLAMAAAALFIWAIYLVLSGFVISRLINAQRNMAEAKNKTSGILQQIFTGLMKFRVKGAEEQAYHLWGEKFAEEWKWNYSARVLKNYNAVIVAVQPILLALVLYYFGLRELAETTKAGVASGAEKTLEDVFAVGELMSVATFIAFQAAYTAFNASLNAIMPVLEQLSVVRPLIENLKPILDAEPEVVEEKMEADVLSGAFTVKHLSFSYGEGLPEVLHDLSFSVAAGEHVAIVGRSGCGKSTLIRLLLGFESPTSGAIYYDGQDLADLDLPSVRVQMGVVLQNGQLMTGDIYRNIVGASDLTLDDAWAAEEAAGIADEIREMPMQMQTVVSEGSTNISGGQRQRILIAKALAMKPAIVVCDEATSALDNRTQAIVTESLDRLKATRVIVAHRLSTIRHADRISVLDEGRIAESGTFDELVAKNGLFASFVKRQVA